MNASTDTRPAFAPDFTSREISTQDDRLMKAVYGLRYQVYVQECGFLPASDDLAPMETDAHDADAAHFCAYNRAQELVGYVRLVPAMDNACLPFERQNVQWLPGAIKPPWAESGEISRLMVRKDYRRRRGDLLSGVTASDSAPTAPQERRKPSPQIMLSLFRHMYSHSLGVGMRFWYAAMERPLLRALSHMGFEFQAVATPMDYYGEVIPCVADLRDLEQRLGHSHPALLQWLQTQPDSAA